MRLNERNDSHEEIVGVRESYALSISDESSAMIIDSLINLYSDPIGSVVRELTSNCIDAHRERDLKKAGKLSLVEGEDQNWFGDKLSVTVALQQRNRLLGVDANISFNDCGVGLSPQRVKDIYTVLGTSTKRDDNHQIGGFGLGCKSPWAYVDNFYVNTRFNGTEYYYLMHKGEKVPSMDLVHTQPTTEKNGTSVIIPLKDGGSNYEVKQFIKAIEKQLSFFDQVVYEGFDTEIKPYDVLEEGPDYVISKKGANYSDQILVGRVLYPLETDENIPSGLIMKFPIGELDLVPSREAIRYTDRTKDAISRKIREVKRVFREQVKEVFNNLTDLKDALIISSNMSKAYYKSSITDLDVVTFKSRYAKIEGLKDVDLSKWDLDIPGITLENAPKVAYRTFKLCKVKGKIIADSKGDFITEISENNEIYKVEDKFSYRINLALDQLGHVASSSYDNSSTLFIKAMSYRTCPPAHWRNIKSLLDVKEIDANGEVIDSDKINLTTDEVLQKVRDAFDKHLNFDNFLIYEDVDTSHIASSIGDQEETAEQKRKRLGKVFYRIMRYDGSTEREEKDVTDLLDKDCPKIVYGFNEDREDLHRLKMLNGAHKVVMISKSNEKHFVRHYYVKDFFMYDERFIKRAQEAVDAWYSYTVLNKYTRNNWIVEILNKGIYSDLEQVDMPNLELPELLKICGKIEPSKATKARVDYIKGWMDSMKIIHNYCIQTYPHNDTGKAELIEFLYDYAVMKNIELDCTVTSLNKSQGLSKMVSMQGGNISNALNKLFGYSKFIEFENKYSHLADYEEKVCEEEWPVGWEVNMKNYFISKQILLILEPENQLQLDLLEF